MIAKTLIFVCATFGLVVGSCFEIPSSQQHSYQIPSPVFSAHLVQAEQPSYTQAISVPIVEKACQSAPVIEKVYQSAPIAQVEATPISTIPLSTSSRFESAPVVAQIETSPRFEVVSAPRIEVAPRVESSPRVEIISAQRYESVPSVELVSSPRVEVVAAPRIEASPRLEITSAQRYEASPFEIELSSSGSSASSNAIAITSSTSGSSSDSYQGPITNGPESSPLPMVQAPAVTLPAVEAPIVTLSSPSIPTPRVIASRCICTKTVVKPQVFQRTITVPKIQRYLKRTVTPVVENVAYKSKPICSGSSSSASSNAAAAATVSYLASQSSSPRSGADSQIYVAESGSSCGCRY